MKQTTLKKFAWLYLVYGLFFLGCFEVARQFFTYYATQPKSLRLVLSGVICISLVTLIITFQKKQAAIRNQLIMKEREKAKRLNNQRKLTKEVVNQSFGKYLNPNHKINQNRASNRTIPIKNDRLNEQLPTNNPSPSPLQESLQQQDLQRDLANHMRLNDSAVLFSTYHTYVIPHVHYDEDVTLPQIHATPDVKNIRVLKNSDEKFLYRPVVNFSYSKNAGTTIKFPPQFLNFN